MKYRYFFALFVLAAGLVAPEAQAQYYYSYSRRGDAGLYTRLELGPSFFQDGRLSGFGGPAGNPVDYDAGYSANAALGFEFNKYVGADFEFGAVGAEIKSVPGFFSHNTSVDNLPFLANLTLSYPIPHTLVVPYIGAGAGGSLTTFNTDGFGNNSVVVSGSESDVVFAWQAFAGLRLKLSNQMSIGIGYKYYATGNPSFSYPPAFPGPGIENFSLGFDGVRTHSVLLTFQFKF